MCSVAEERDYGLCLTLGIVPPPFSRIKRSGLSIVAHFRQISAYLFEDR